MIRWMVVLIAVVCVSCVMALGGAKEAKQETTVQFHAVPNGGTLPRAMVDKEGTLHLVYFKGEHLGGDLFYVKRKIGEEAFSKPIRVNNTPNAAMSAMKCVGRVAIGEGGRIHLLWYGSKTAKPRTPAETMPVMYSRMNDNGDGFEPEINLANEAYRGLDGGADIAADGKDRVYAFWHCADENAPKNSQSTRRVFMARSLDNGKTWEKERPVNPENTGCCPCCRLDATVDSDGDIYVLYRIAQGGGKDRAISLLHSDNGGKTFSFNKIHEWDTPS